jgi:hypothetical protein
MSNRLTEYLGLIIIIPIFITILVGLLELAPEDFIVMIFLLSLISTHLVVSKIQDMIYG